MGYKLFDQYSYLHFCVGVIIYFLSIKIKDWIIIHCLFELLENTPLGIEIINKYLTFWPGGKPRHDNILNILGDNIAAVLGWYSAYYIDNIGIKYKWYEPHIKKF